FDPSVYHERYIMSGLALTLALAPRLLAAVPSGDLRLAAMASYGIAVLWLGMAVLNIRVTLPLWSNQTKLWQWPAAQDKDSSYAKTNLLALAIDREDKATARKLADELLADKKPCLVCMVNVAVLAMDDGDLERAKLALERAQEGLAPTIQPRLVQGFVLA